MSPSARLRRVSPIAPNTGEGLLTEPTPAAQPDRRELVFMPLGGDDGKQTFSCPILPIAAASLPFALFFQGGNRSITGEEQAASILQQSYPVQ